LAQSGLIDDGVDFLPLPHEPDEANWQCRPRLLADARINA